MPATDDSRRPDTSVASEHPAKATLLSLLSRIAPSFGLTTSAVRELTHRARIADWNGGRTICVSADRDDFVNFLMKGSVCVNLEPRGGKPVALKLVGGGEFFCLPPSPRSGAYHLRAVAYEASLVALWGRATIEHVLGMLPASGSIRLMTSSWLALSRVAEEKCVLLSLPLRRRIEFVLPELAKRFGRPVGRGILIDLGLSDEQLGQVVHASRSSVNRQMMALRRAGVVERTGDRIVLVRRRLTGMREEFARGGAGDGEREPIRR